MFNLGNAYQAMDKLPKAKECYEIALGHAIYGNDLHGQVMPVAILVTSSYVSLKEQLFIMVMQNQSFLFSNKFLIFFPVAI